MHTRVIKPRHGPELLVRPLRRGVVATVLAVFERLGNYSRRARFHGPKPCLSDVELEQLAAVDESHHALVAYVAGDPHPIAIARLARTDQATAEIAFAVAAGVREELVCLDPGIGFGKTVEQNFELVRRLDELVAIGRPILIGFSRKSSLARILGDPNAKVGTTAASVGAAVSAFDRGATILRVHDVREHVEALAAAKAVRG